MNRRLPLIVAPLIVMAFAVSSMQPPPPGITKANFDRIKVGMTQEDVESFFGEPPCSTVDGERPSHAWTRPDGAGGNVVFVKGRVVAMRWYDPRDDE